jgi:hypothetical protein
MKFPIKGKAINNPQPMHERPNRIRYDLQMPQMMVVEERERAAKRKLREHFAGRRPVVTSWTQQPLVMRHTRDKDSLFDECKPNCLQCGLEKRAADGRPVIEYVMHIERDSLHERVVAPRRHKNPRQAKKWAKLGVVSEQPKREKEVWVLTQLQFRVLRDIWNTLRRARRALEC